jgi:hyperpolarization activated cyclic nucleotide-gated potassium channel 2
MISKQQTTARAKTRTIIEKKYVFRPESLLRFLWEIFMLILVLYLGVSLPYILAFQENDPMPVFNEYIITTLYFVDIGINFNTAVYIRGILRLNHKLIIREYLKFWFWIDLVSALPIDMIIELSSSNVNYLKTVRLIKFIRVFKLIKLVKLGKLKYTIAKIEDRISSKDLIFTRNPIFNFSDCVLISL